MIEFLIQTDYNSIVFNIWIGVAITTNALFLLELVIHVVVFGTSWILTQKKILLLEAGLQVIAIYADFKFTDGNYYTTLEAIKLCCIVYMFRSFRLLYLLSEIRQFDLIFSTFLRFTMPFFTMCLSLYTIFYIFAQIGMGFFGSKITTVSA